METTRPNRPSGAVPLPTPATGAGGSLEEVLRARRSVRAFTAEPLTLAQVAQLAWAAQGVTGEGGLRAAPSAGGLNPLELYVVAGAVDGLAPGVYRYDPAGHELAEVRPGDVRTEFAAATFNHGWVADGAAVLVLAAVYERTTRTYGEGSERYVHMDIGHAGQNVCLQAVALGLATCVVAALDEERVRVLLGLPSEERPVVALPIGRPGE